MDNSVFIRTIQNTVYPDDVTKVILARNKIAAGFDEGDAAAPGATYK